jgi:hypothetical protein
LGLILDSPTRKLPRILFPIIIAVLTTKVWAWTIKIIPKLNHHALALMTLAPIFTGVELARLENL